MSRGKNISPNEAKTVFTLIPERGYVNHMTIRKRISNIYGMEVSPQRVQSAMKLLCKMSLIGRKKYRGVFKIAPADTDVVAAVTAHRIKGHKKKAVPSKQRLPGAIKFDGVMIVHNGIVSQMIDTKDYHIFARNEAGLEVEVSEGDVKIPNPKGWLRRLLGF